MPDQEQKVCDVCHQFPAIYHMCDAHTGVTRSRCLKCFEQTASPAELESYRESGQMFRHAKCKYCGAPAVGGAVSGWTNFDMPGFKGKEESEFWCEFCRLDMVEFANRPENARPEDLDTENEIFAQLEEEVRRKDEFMRQRVRARLQ